MNEFRWQHQLNPSLCLYVPGPFIAVLTPSALGLCKCVRNYSGNFTECGEKNKDIFVFSWISSWDHLINRQHTSWWWCRAGGSSEKGRELRATYNILNNHAAESGTRAWIGNSHRKVRKCPIVNSETSNNMNVKADKISFQAAMQNFLNFILFTVSTVTYNVSFNLK